MCFSQVELSCIVVRLLMSASISAFALFGPFSELDARRQITSCPLSLIVQYKAASDTVHEAAALHTESEAEKKQRMSTYWMHKGKIVCCYNAAQFSLPGSYIVLPSLSSCVVSFFSAISLFLPVSLLLSSPLQHLEALVDLIVWSHWDAWKEKNKTDCVHSFFF